MALTKVTKSGLTGDVVDETLIADNAISEEHLDATAVSGNTALGEAAAANDFLLIYDSSAGTLKKVAASNVGTQAVTLSSVSPTNALTGDGTGNATFTITGTNLTGATAVLVTTGGSEVEFDTITVDSSTQITGVIANSSLSSANDPYDVRVYGSNGLQATLRNQINVDASPIFNTASGSVGSFQEQTTISTIDIEAYDPDSAGNVTFEIQSGSLPAGLSATTVNENGVSKYRITGTLTADIASDTTSNFTLRAVDAASNTTSRAFSITVTPYSVESFTSSGTFSVPVGVTSVDVLVVAGGGASGGRWVSNTEDWSGGGGGAGGLIFMPGYPVTPGGTVSVTVGCGGANSPDATYPAVPGQDSVFGTLTAKGGGGGGYGGNNAGHPGAQTAGSGGSGGGSGAGQNSAPGGSATQPTQPGNSGAYGFGNAGSAGTPSGQTGGGGGGGAGAAAGSSGPGTGGSGGNGKAYSIADGTTPVYYAGGGGGAGGFTVGGPGTGGTGGQGGGGNGGSVPGTIGAAGTVGAANKGGGAGAGGGHPTGYGAAGGKGIVIVTWS
jgi:hypothetical protein